MSDKNKRKRLVHIQDLIKKLDSFLDASKESDILIIKAHLLCEYYVNQILIFNEMCSAKEVEGLTFRQKIDKAFSGDEESKQVFHYLIRLNLLRNKVGHELTYKLAESDVDSLGYVQGKQYIMTKYEFETDEERLHDILSEIVVSTAFKLIAQINKEKKKIESDKSENENNE